MKKKNIIIVGGGFTGLSAAYDLTKAGHSVTILESDSQLGGLAGIFEIQPGVFIEKFYHHWFSSDTSILGLISELGLEGHLKRVETNTGLFHVNSIFRLASPLDLLKFKPIPFLDRIRTGLMALYARSISNWKYLEDISAQDWIKKIAGNKSFSVIWEPLLKGKFGKFAPEISAVWFWNKLKLRGSSRNEKAAEELIYFNGGFGKITEALTRFVTGHGGSVRTNTRITEVIVEGGVAKGVKAAGGETFFGDEVLITTPIPHFLEMVKELPEAYRNKCSQIRYIGNTCLILELDRSLSSTYWLNVSDPNFPFVGVIEHTNLDGKENYSGRHIAYISKYLPTDDPLYSYSNDEYFEFCFPFLKKIFPAFEKSWVINHHVWRAEYSQPLITKRYSELIPGFQTPVKNLWLASMAQVYPEDRGTNYAVREGRKVAGEICSAPMTG